jgi:2-polyprenyl-6-methoxyphenol hydroxylase-like FAD-dependent oxidoreductase
MAFDYDVAIIGGAFSGTAAALMLKRKHPAARVLIIEKTTEFDRTFSGGRQPAGSSAETPVVTCKI